jgi:hypothetical protein
MNSTTLAFSPLLPWPWLAALAVFALIGAGLLVHAGRRGALMRMAALALALIGLADPRIVTETRQPLEDIVALVVDRSGSQTLDARKSQTDSALATLQARLKARPNTQVRLIEVQESETGGEGTQLFTAITQGLRDVPADRLAGVIALTDGVVHDLPASGKLPFAAPFHVLVTGREGEFDRRVELVEAPRFGLVGKEVTASIRIEIEGARAAPARLTVKRNGEVLLSRMVMPQANIPLPLKIDRVGMNLFEIAIETAPGELTPLNNTLALPIEGVREKLRALLVSGEPHAGERTWRNLLKADPNVDLVHFTILRPPEKQDGTPTNELSLIAFPTRELFITKIKEFDLIIFDRYSHQTFLPSAYFENMVRYVREGGAILFAVGPEILSRNGLLSTPIASILPAMPSGSMIERPFRAQLTDLGRRHPVTRALEGAGKPGEGATWAPFFRQIAAQSRSGAQGLMQGPEGNPLLELKREGKGRVGLMLSDHVWLWARGYKGGGPYLDLLRRLSHWLMKEPELEEEVLRLSAAGNRIVIERRTLGGPPGPVRLTEPAGTRESISLAEVEPGFWRAEMNAKRAGLYKAENGTLTSWLNIGQANPREFRKVVSTTALLAPLAATTGGSIRRLETSGTLHIPKLVDIRTGTQFSGEDYIGLRPTEASLLTGVAIAPLGLGFLGLALLLLPLILTWAMEGRRRRS